MSPTRPRVAGSLLVATLALGVARAAPGDRVPVDGSTWRLELEAGRPGSERLHVYADATECAARGWDPARCAPQVVPSAREFRLGFDVRGAATDGEARRASPLQPGEVEVFVGVDKARGTPARVPPDDVVLVPHEAAGRRQFFVVLVDQSSSMYDADASGTPMMTRVGQALLHPSLTDVLFPDEAGNSSDVLLLGFRGQVRGVDGRAWSDAEPVRDLQAYRAAVDGLRREPAPGYTHLYDAVETVLVEVLADPDVSAIVASTKADPVVIVFTDGFNNEASSDRCRDNVGRLDAVRRVVQSSRADRGTVPRLHTVGLGAPFRPGYVPPVVQSARLDAEALCGWAADERIDGDLETRGIDNVSLALLARDGGGASYVGDDPRRLAGFLAESGSAFHEWFELRFRLDPERGGFARATRRPVPVLVRAEHGTVAEARFTLHPHPWFDLPAGAGQDAEGWAVRPSVWGPARTLLWILTATTGLLGGVVAWRNLGRLLTRRARRVS